MKKVSRITKGTVITILLVLAASVVLGLGGTYAFGQIAQNNAIGSDAAANFAFIDAGVAPEDALVLKNRFDYEDRTFVYEIEFLANGTNYDYVIRASDGAVMSGEYETAEGVRASTGDTRERARADAAREMSRQNAAAQASRAGSGETAQNAGAGSSETPSVIGVSEAKQIALREAGLTEEDGVVFTTAKLEDDDAQLMYAIEFYQGDTEYEVDVDAARGTVLSYSTEAKEPANTNNKPAQAAKQTPQATTPAQTAPQTTPTQQTPQATQQTPVQTTPQVTQPVQQTPQVTVPTTPQVTTPVQTTPQITVPAQTTPQTPVYDDDDDDYDDYDDDDNYRYQAPAQTPSMSFDHDDFDFDDDDD